MCAFPICSDNFSLYLSHFQTHIIINKKNIFIVQIFIEMPLNMLRNGINLILIKLWSSSFVRIRQEVKKSRYRRVNVYIISLLRYIPVLNLYLHGQTHTQVIYVNKILNHSQKKDMCSLHQWRNAIEFKHFFMHEEI